jgi:hypothetical protein
MAKKGHVSSIQRRPSIKVRFPFRHSFVIFQLSNSELFDFAGRLFMNAFFLFYSALVVPIQLSFWEELGNDPCTSYPTLYCDFIVDTFFLVNRSIRFNQIGDMLYHCP